MGSLVQAGRGFLLYTGFTMQCANPPVLGTLVQAGRGFLLYTGFTMQCANPPVLGTLVQAGRGIPLYIGFTTQGANPARFGNLGTGRPGIPSFIALGDGSPAASGHRPRFRSSRPAGAGPPPASATTPITQTRSPVDVLAVELELTLLHLAFGFEQQRDTAIDNLAMDLGFIVEPRPPARYPSLRPAAVRWGRAWSGVRSSSRPSRRQSPANPSRAGIVSNESRLAA